jgi:RNA polymerase sigma-70 factor (ECF subfamily)
MPKVAMMEHPVESARRADLRNDTELIAAVNSGDVDAFEALYWRYRDWVIGLAWRFTGDSDLALDVMQETFLYLLRKFPGFRLTAKLKTFLYPAVRHLSMGARRKATRYQSKESDLQAIEALATTAPDSGDDAALAAVLANLPALHREVLLLRFIDELSLQEIAAAIDIPLGTVKSRLHNALATLREDPRTKSFFEG